MTEREMNALQALIDEARECSETLRRAGRRSKAEMLKEAVVEMEEARREADGE